MKHAFHPLLLCTCTNGNLAVSFGRMFAGVSWRKLFLIEMVHGLAGSVELFIRLESCSQLLREGVLTGDVIRDDF